MNKHNAPNEDKIAEIETQAITDTAKKWNLSEELVGEITQDYAEMIENFERFLNERYPDDNINTQPYVIMEITLKATRDIADKHSMDGDIVRMIIQDYTEMVRNAHVGNVLEEPD